VDPISTEPASVPSPAAPRAPATRIALVVATIASGACVYAGYVVGMEGGCDGGLCGLPKFLGWVAAFVAWPIVFGVMWGLVRLAMSGFVRLANLRD
jgi:hypothetical protein